MEILICKAKSCNSDVYGLVLSNIPFTMIKPIGFNYASFRQSTVVVIKHIWSMK